MFDKILIANRGEIACRVARTARRMGIRTVAVYSEADARALHVSACDEAFLIGPPPARESYLRAERILEVAQRAGAQAVHPGYGFLSENEGFAEACAAAGVTFIGPPPAAIRAMGSKSNSKQLMEKAGVPLVPGYHGDDQDPALLAREAERIGFPVLIKASAGGGGKGMRVVRTAAEFADALASAKREAASAFGDDHVLIERYLMRPRHVELQVFADRHGHCIHLFERDCSVQRRHQKVLEEAPAPGLPPERRRQMGSAAVAAARAVGYEGAGTVEFILDASGEFFFMEMNTRLQVEHPVTEKITGLDLVEWQLRVAAGEPLPLAQDQVMLRGHAIEARIYAEDPARGFMPATGRLTHLREPAQSAHVRVDTGVREGDEIGVHYDPMIAKLICWDTDRDGALRRLRQALSEYQVAGLTNNIAFLSAVTAHRAFAEAHRDPALLDTGLIERHAAELFPAAVPVPDEVLAIAVLSELVHADTAARERAQASGDPHSPWHARDGWRMNEDNFHVFRFVDGDNVVPVIAHYRSDGYLLEMPGGASIQAQASEAADGALHVDLGGVRSVAHAIRRGADLTVFSVHGTHRLALEVRQTIGDDEAAGSLAAPMPGSVIQVLVGAGDQVEKGAPLMIIEAMKMEHTIAAPRAGTVKAVFFAAGDQVQEGVNLLEFEAAA
ncbi:MAG: acetyl/propionyl/methylcrotonyl-CoA carboxylase subunit alpha [Burkholderiales bacterium]|nr:acetyl/propionyl/methylcrotonyl-CoA carboxylase subunit alpha [Burkholderiales bacterium]